MILHFPIDQVVKICHVRSTTEIWNDLRNLLIMGDSLSRAELIKELEQI